MGKVAFGTGPHRPGLTGTAKCLLCPLDPPFPLPSEFFPLTKPPGRLSFLSSSREQSMYQDFCTSFHWEHWEYRASP